MFSEFFYNILQPLIQKDITKVILTANASGLTPFSQRLTHKERQFLSKPVLSITEISYKTNS